ncbi:transcription factor TFIIIB component B'' homolog [Centropristis striata]|uniref:transcription factor TFIIIB component B'' homolog n=1 Tax=Centropristis striata TaxID=184440 RepID=UPI0027E199CA|nr:transcription factor TFIIIB component B'' homolog [Centropristis striata]
MFRRSRFSIRPNVGTVGRTAATPQETPSASQDASETPKDVSESSPATAVTDNKSIVTPSEKPAAPGEGNDQNGEGTSSSAAVQRRKRFSIKPKVAPGRPSALPRVPKSPAKASSETPIEVPVSNLDKPSKTTQSAAPQRLQSPRRRRLSEETKQLKTQPKLSPSDSTESPAVPPAEDSLEQSPLPAESSKELESTSGSQVKEVPSRPPDKVPPSLPDKEAFEISEKAKTLVSSKSGLSLSAPAFSLSRLLNDPSDLQRLAKARKLRELLKQEMHKEKKIKKFHARAKEYTIDPAKMTMRDLIRYLPLSNPMTSSLEESVPENETVVPPSPVREELPERAQTPEALPKIASPTQEEEAEPEEEQDDGIMVPQVKVAEDGSLIIDEESLTVEVLRAKGPNPAQDRDPIFERGSTTTYSSFRKGTYSKPWSNEETDMFFLAISMVGTDFSMICQLFPHRARSEIKNKFKKEERENSWRIDKAFRERRKLDIEYFSKLLEKILEVQKNRKKLKSLAEKKPPKKQKRKGKKAARKLSVVEEEDEEEQNEIADLEEEGGEKENEDLCNEGGTTVDQPKKKRKRKNKQDASAEEPYDKKNKTGEINNEQDEAHIPGDTEAALPEDRPKTEMSEKTESSNEAKDTTIKPAKLSRGRAPKPLLPLGRKWDKKPPAPSTKANDTASDKVDESVIDGASEEQVNKEASPERQANKRKSANDDYSSEEEDSTVQPPRPTRYGRVPKPTKPLNYPAKEAAHSSASDTTPASPAGSTASAARPKPKCTAKRGRSSKLQSEFKKPKLVTLRASQSEYSDDEDERQREEEDVEEEEHPACSPIKDSDAPVFVPASLRSPHPVISEVEETMEELDILANMPDVLGISQDALCPDGTCEQAQNETGTAEPCEHQLDLLVDVIDFLSSEHTEVSEDESYNEAAQTLLTIGNLAHLSQSAHNQIATQDQTTGTPSVCVSETSQHVEEEIALMPAAQEENSATLLMSPAPVHGVIETSETVTTVELQSSLTDNDDVPVIKSSDERTGPDMDPTPQLHSSLESSKENSPQTKRGHFSQPEMSTGRTAEERQTVAPGLSRATETLSAAVETPKLADYSQEFLKDAISCFEVKCTEEQSGSVGKLYSGAATSDQSASENRSDYFSEAQFEPSLEQTTRDSRSTSKPTDEVVMSHIGTTDSSHNNQVTSHAVVTESQLGQGSNIDLVPDQESSDHPASCVEPIEKLPVSQVEKSEVASTRPTRSRFQKVKPNLAPTSRAVRSKPETTKDAKEKDSNPTPNPKFYEKPTEVVNAEPTCTTSAQKTNLIPGPSPDLITSLDLSSTLTPTEDLSRTEEKQIDVGVVGQVQSDAASSNWSASENQNFAEDHCREQATRDTRPTSEPTVRESQVGQGSTIDLAPVQESNEHSASCVTHEEELLVSQKEKSEVESICQARRGRLQKVKPKPNLPQTSRSVRVKPQTTNDTAEEDSNPTPKPKLHEKTIAEVEAEKTSQSTGLSPDVIPLFDSGYTPTPMGQCAAVAKQTDVGVVGQTDLDVATAEQSASENQNRSEAQLESSREQATKDTRTTSTKSIFEVLMSHVGTIESSPNILLTSDAPATESQTGQGSNIDSVQEINNPLASCASPVKQLPVNKKEESEVASTSQTRKSRFQKVKPNLNLALISRTVRSKSPTTKDSIKKDSNSTPNPKFIEKTIAVVEAESTCTTSAEQPSQSTGPGSDLLPSFDLGSTLKPTEELSTTVEKKTDVGGVGQVKSGSETSDHNDSEKQNFSEALPAGREQATIDATPTLESTNDVPMPHIETIESKCNSPPTSESAVTELQVGQETKVESPCQMKRVRFQKVRPKPILPQTSRTVQSKSQNTKDPIKPKQLGNAPSSPTSRPESSDNTIEEEKPLPSSSTTPPENLSQNKSTGSASVSVPSLELCSTTKSSTEEQRTDAACGVDSNSECSEKNVPQSRRRFPKVKPKPNLGSSPRITRTKLLSNDTSEPSEPCHMDTSLTSEQQPVNNNNAQKELSETDRKHLQVAGKLSLLPDLNPRVEQESTGDQGSNDRTEARPASQWERNQVMSIKAAEKKTQPTDDATAVSDVQSIEDSSVKSKIESLLPTYTQATPDAKESSQQPQSEKNSEAQSQDAIQQCSENTEANQTAGKSTDDIKSEPTDSPSRKAPQIRRGRLIKPKPSLGRSRRPPQSVQSTTQADADSNTLSEVVDTSLSHKPVSEHQPDIQEPVEGTVEQCNNPDVSSNDAGSPLGCLTQVIDQLNQQDSPPNVAGSSLGGVTHAPDTCTQIVSTLSTGGTQGHQSLTIFPDMLSQQEPSDPDEPFFILSLTEIPVCSSGEMVGSVPEPLPYLPVTDASIEQQSIAGKRLAAAAAGEEPLSEVTVPVTRVESGFVGLTDIGSDPAAYKGPITESPIDPHESTAVNPSELSESVENNDETESPPTKQRLMGTRRREPAKLPVKPNSTKRKQASKTLPAKEAESVPIQTHTTQHSELPGSSVQPKVFDVVTEPQKGSGDHVEVERETLTGGEDPGESSSGAQTTLTKGTSRRNRKPESLCEKNNPDPASRSPSGKAASKGCMVKAPRAAGKKSTPAPAASTSCDVAPTASLTQPAEETHSTPCTTSQTEFSASQKSDCLENSFIEEEPTSVSQYFLSDIFTNAFDEVEPQKESGDHVDAVKETLTGGEDTEESSSGGQTSQTQGASSRNRKDLLSETNISASSDSPFDKVASKGRKVKTSCAAGKQSTPAPVASISCDVAPTSSLIQSAEETHSASSATSPTQTHVDAEQTPEHSRLCSDTAPSTSLYEAEVSATQQRDCLEGRSIEEEPTNVSQYSLSDIFTKPFDDDVTEPQKGSGDHVDVVKETLTGVEDPEESSSGAQTTRTRGTSSRNRKAKGFLSKTSTTASSNDSPSGKAASQGPKVKTQSAAGKRSTPAPVASTSCDVAPTASSKQPNTSPCPAEENEEEPTNVSQYFLSDIFTKSCDDVVTEPQTGSGDHVDAVKETLAGGEDPEESSSGAQTTQTKGARSRNRKAKGLLPKTATAAPASDSPSGKAASKGRKVKTPCEAAPVASTSCDAAPTSSLTQLAEETHSASSVTSPTQTEADDEQIFEHSQLCSDTLSTPPCLAEVSAPQQSECVESGSIEEEEPINVSQYFLSDIFTEVDEG